MRKLKHGEEEAAREKEKKDNLLLQLKKNTRTLSYDDHMLTPFGQKILFSVSSSLGGQLFLPG